MNKMENKKRPGLGLPIAKFPQKKINPEIEHKLREINKKNGLIEINGKSYQTSLTDLEDLGELGNGTSGHVVKMRHKPSGAIIAVKQMRRTGNDEETKRIIMDLDVVLKSHDCPYIVKCLGCFITEADVWICMELMSSCFDKLQKRTKSPIPEDILRHVTEATVSALSYLKDSHGVIHRDVKPSNILIDEKGEIKLCDFGISGRLVDSKAKTRSAGCAAYMAPERIDPKKPEYDIRADVWSLGITLVELATGAYPYRGCNTDFEVLTKVLEAEPPSLPDNQGFSIDFRDFVRQCLIKNFHKRPKYQELMKHEFLNFNKHDRVDVSVWFRQVTEAAGIKLPTQDITQPQQSQQQQQQQHFLNRLTALPPPNNSSINKSHTDKLDNSTIASSSSATIITTASSSSSIPKNTILENNIQNQLNKNSNNSYNPFISPTNSGLLPSVSSSAVYHNTSEQKSDPLIEATPIATSNVTAAATTTMTNLVTKITTTAQLQQFHHTPQYSPHAQQHPQHPPKETFGEPIYNNHIGTARQPAKLPPETVNEHLANEMNRLYQRSPFMPRKANLELNNASPQPLPKLGPNQYQSPYLQRKTYEYQYLGNGYQQLPSQQPSSLSPVIRKRYQQGYPVAEDLQYRHLQGNTSPIVLQRFYHQQNQLRDKREEEPLPPTPPNRYQLDESNPFRNNYGHQQTSGIPMRCNSPNLRHIQHHPNPSPAQLPIYSYQSPPPTQIPQLQQKRHHEPIYQQNIHTYGTSQENFGSNIPVYQYKQLNNGSPRTDNNRSPAPQPPSSPYLDRIRANMEKPNFYEKNQKLPLDSTTFGLDVTGSSNGVTEKTKEDQVQTGWFNSIAGVVKRRFATYMKLHLASNGDAKDKSKKDKDKEKVKSLATVSPIKKNFISNPFAQSPSTQFTNVQPLNSSPQNHGITGIDRRHRSPDPPPRLNRGQQSPLLLRHKLELAQSGSPLMQKRFMSASPPPLPPRVHRFCESVPGSPVIRNRIQYTPEPQRRVAQPMYRPLD